jgi:hypothetical protein
MTCLSHLLLTVIIMTNERGAVRAEVVDKVAGYCN